MSKTARMEFDRLCSNRGNSSKCTHFRYHQRDTETPGGMAIVASGSEMAAPHSLTARAPHDPNLAATRRRQAVLLPDLRLAFRAQRRDNALWQHQTMRQRTTNGIVDTERKSASIG